MEKMDSKSVWCST